MNEMAGFFSLCGQTFVALVTPPLRWRETLQQLYFVANGSWLIIVFCVSFAAVVTILEASFHMKLVIQNDSMVPGFAAMLILRELGTVVTALLLTSKVGAGFTAEVGLMKVTEQIDAFRMLGIDPVRYLVVPRLIACTIGTVLLSVIANIVCLLCAMIVSDWQMGYSPAMFLSAIRVFVKFQDLFWAALKGFFFGAAIPLIACYYGFRCKEGAEGVGRATTNSVVASAITIIVMDFVLSYTFSQL